MSLKIVKDCGYSFDDAVRSFYKIVDDDEIENGTGKFEMPLEGSGFSIQHPILEFHSKKGGTYILFYTVLPIKGKTVDKLSPEERRDNSVYLIKYDD